MNSSKPRTAVALGFIAMVFSIMLMILMQFEEVITGTTPTWMIPVIFALLISGAIFVIVGQWFGGMEGDVKEKENEQ